jgi:hypothetical protein
MAQAAPTAPISDVRPDCPEPSQPHFLGLGLYLLGERDPDEATGSFVKTLYFCLLYLPVLAWRAYRVEPTDDGWRYLARVPVSGQARVFSLIATFAILGGSGYIAADMYRNTPAAIASRKLAEADRLAAEGRIGDAAKLLSELARWSVLPAGRASSRLEQLLDDPASRSDPEGRGVAFREAVTLQRTGRWQGSAQSLHDRGLSLARETAEKDPRGAWAILDAIAPLASQDQEAEAGFRHELLEKVVAAEPSNAEWASRLAVEYESRNQLDRAERVLSPLRANLGELEGARVLGLCDARANRVDQAVPLLRSYARNRLERLGQAEARLRTLARAAQERVIGELKNRRVYDFDYEGYQRADMPGKEAILNGFLEQRLKGDPELSRAQEAVVAESPVVAVVIELGMLLLQQAQGQADPSARKAILDEAESSFLAVSRMAGEKAEVQLNLAQVYYWQGKTAEGRKLVDEVLRARNRDPALLLQVASMLRDVGSNSEARALAEEGYEHATDSQVKDNCATLRGVMGDEVEDRILWLRRARSNHPFVKALLSSDLARQAIEQGNEELAVANLREAAALYDAMPESPSTLNNGSIALRELAALTGDAAALERAGTKIEKAVALEPGNSLTMMTASSTLLEAGLRDIIGRSVDLRLIKAPAALELFGFLAKDESEREALAAQLRSHPVVNRALALMDKVMVLAPRNPHSYASPTRILAYREDSERLRRILNRLDSVDLDLGDEIKKARATYAGQKEDELRGRAKAALSRFEALLPVARAKGGPTFAVAASFVLSSRIYAARHGLAVDRDALVALAEEAFAASPSLSSRQALERALLFRASDRLARAEPGFARLRDQFVRADAAELLEASVLSPGSKFRDLALKDADVLRVIDFARDSYAASPRFSSGPRSWALLRARYPEVATDVAKSYLGYEASRIAEAIDAKLQPYDAAAVLEAYWAALMQDKESEGLRILSEARARGVPISIEMP